MIPLKDNIPTRRPPVVTVGFIVLNVLVYLNQMMLPEKAFVRFLYLYGLIPVELTQGVELINHPVPLYATIFTSMFVHAGLFHVGGNMLYLWIFGNNVEDSMGHLRFIVFYLFSGIAAALAQIAVNPASQVPMVGASGAVSGVLGAYLLLYPHARVVTLVSFGWFLRFVEVPALVVLGFWIVVQLFNGLLTFNFQGGGVAWFAHIGGFFAGMLLIGFFKRPSVPWGWRRDPWRDPWS
ncbi:MAG: rhomboid family intramembrane serine protease [Candidatus Methylomirabilales bacterium]